MCKDDPFPINGNLVIQFLKYTRKYSFKKLIVKN